jgi:hypothetical protein
MPNLYQNADRAVPMVILTWRIVYACSKASDESLSVEHGQLRPSPVKRGYRELGISQIPYSEIPASTGLGKLCCPSSRPNWPMSRIVVPHSFVSRKLRFLRAHLLYRLFRSSSMRVIPEWGNPRHKQKKNHIPIRWPTRSGPCRRWPP